MEGGGRRSAVGRSDDDECRQQVRRLRTVSTVWIMTIGNYSTLAVWQASMTLVVEIYRISSSLPPAERYGLTQQLRRAAISVPSNIAEGHSRRSRREYLRYVVMALGSLAEVETQVSIAARLAYLEPDASTAVQQLIDRCAQLLRALEKALIRQLREVDIR
jgi:four helix bundle protein